ncbi:unnamed protein product [Dovyalis caffra]|uniref:Uncharacterized protein n=1 Tax=Dovyalis caffra TaxID=77055 RepID=A0AAV1SB66_9ROSI|nr:unnamed protein product [Dovyalis caffra]
MTWQVDKWRNVNLMEVHYPRKKQGSGFMEVYQNNGDPFKLPSTGKLTREQCGVACVTGTRFPQRA